VSGRRVLVTGGSGFIGTNLIEHLLAAGDDVLNLDAAAPRFPAHAPVWRNVDILDAGGLERAVESFAPTFVCHLAARVDLAGADVEHYRANTDGVRNLLGAALAGGVERVLFGSSQLVCTPGHLPVDDLDVSPPNAYGQSKVIGEQIVRAEAGDDLTWVLLRPTSIWGPWFGELYSAFFRTVQRGRYVHPRGVRVRKSFGYVGNTVHQIDRLLDAPAARLHGRTLYMADYEPYPILEWARLIQAEFGSRPIREVPVPLLRALARGGDLLQRLGRDNPPLTSYRLRNLLTETVFDLEPLRALCGDLPYSLAEATHRTAAWMRDNPT
jgi:nucleoside-diphosphate-sugar epimerase